MSSLNVDPLILKGSQRLGIVTMGDAVATQEHQIALAGCGQWGQNIARVLAGINMLHAVIDPDEKRVTETSTTFAAPCRTWGEVLEDNKITAIVLATPASQHEIMAVQALESGKHVFVEKPLALTADGAETVALAAEKYGKIAMVGHLFLYHPVYIAVKSLLHEKRVGNIQHVFSTRLNFGRIRQEEDVLWHLAPHDVAMVLDLVGELPTHADANVSTHLHQDLADIASVHLKFPSGVQADILVSWLYPTKERKLVLVGDQGMMVFDDCREWDEKLMLFDSKVEWRDGVPQAVKGVGKAICLKRAEPLLEELRHFIECINCGRPPKTDVQDGIRVVNVLRSLQRSGHKIANTSHLVNTSCHGFIAENSPITPTIPLIPARVIPLIDLGAQKAKIRRRLEQRIAMVLDGEQFIMGPEVQELERKLASFAGVKHVITCASGTDAITLSLMALNIGPGDAVLVPAFTFIATAEPIVLLGANPIIVDVEPRHLTIDPSMIEAGIRVARAAGYVPKGIIAVDIFGHPANYAVLGALAAEHNVWLIADAAQSFGANVGGRNVGSLASITTTSFFPSKPLGCYGDGGAIFTDDDHIATDLRSLRAHGAGRDKFDNVRVGMNSRLDTLQAAILLTKLEIFEDEFHARQIIAASYETLLKGLVETPVVRVDTESAWASYTIQIDNPESLRKHLDAVGVSSSVLYRCPLHRQLAYQDYPVAAGECVVAERAATRVLSLPMHPYLEVPIQEYVVAAIREFKSKSHC